jgi:hypothetical protein
MLIKERDNSEDISELEWFLKNPKIPEQIKNKIEKEIKYIKSGITGQKEAEYNIDFHYKNSLNNYIIHDLRIELNGLVAQIDHLIINRFLDVAVCESKNFFEGVGINNNLEFSSFYAGKPHGISSPIEQNKRHIKVLKICLVVAKYKFQPG